LCYVFLLTCFLEGTIVVQSILPLTNKISCMSCSWEDPPPNNPVVSKWNQKKSNPCLCWYFLALVCCAIGNTLAQLIEPYSLTARPTQVSLCTCLCQKKVYCLFTQTMSSLTFFFLETLSKILIKFSSAQLRSHLCWLPLFSPGSSKPLPLWIMLWLYHPNLRIPYWFCPVIWLSANPFSSIRCWSCLNLSFLVILIPSSLRIMTLFYRFYL
jgi:hypothetical protein